MRLAANTPTLHHVVLIAKTLLYAQLLLHRLFHCSCMNIKSAYIVHVPQYTPCFTVFFIS